MISSQSCEVLSMVFGAMSSLFWAWAAIQSLRKPTKSKFIDVGMLAIDDYLDQLYGHLSSQAKINAGAAGLACLAALFSFLSKLLA